MGSTTKLGSVKSRQAAEGAENQLEDGHTSNGQTENPASQFSAENSRNEIGGPRKENKVFGQ